MKLWTDYPFKDTDTPGKRAPVRKVSLISFDGNKYATIRYRGVEYDFKAGYLYSRPFRLEGNNLKKRGKSARRGVRRALEAVSTYTAYRREQEYRARAAGFAAKARAAWRATDPVEG